MAELNDWLHLMRAQNEARARSAETVQLWRDGLRGLTDNLLVLNGHRPARAEDGPRDRVLLGVLTHALNSQLAGLHLAEVGYYAQALPLARVCLEDWAAWWYVYNFPTEAKRFLGDGAPNWNEMRQKLETCPGGHNFRLAQRWMNWLHKLAHVEFVSLSSTWDGDQLPIGPRVHTDWFVNCASIFFLDLNVLLDTVEKMCREFHVKPSREGFSVSFGEKHQTWQQIHGMTETLSEV